MKKAKWVLIAAFCMFAQSAFANLIGEEVSYQRIFQDGLNPAVPDDATFIAGPGIEFTQEFGSFNIDVSAASIRFNCVQVSCAFGDLPPHEMRFFFPLPIIDTAVESAGVPSFDNSNVSFTRHKLVVDVNNLTGISENGFFQVNLTLGSPTKAVPIWSPWSLTILILGVMSIFLWSRRRAIPQS